MDPADNVRPSAAPLPKPRFPDAYDGGLGYDDIRRSPNRNLLVLVGPWDGFQDGATVQILVGPGPDRELFGSAPASKEDENGVVDVLIPAVKFADRADGVYETIARVINVLGQPVDSIVEPVRLKLSVPGDLDPVADTPYRNENLGTPQVSPAVIGPDTATATVTIPPWDNMIEADQLILRWGVAGNELVHDVDAVEVGQPIVLTVDRAMLDQGGFGEDVNVNYQVFDLVGNWSLWSPPDLVDVEDPDALDPPWVAPTVDEEGRVIDLDALGGSDVTAEVFGLQQGDVVVVRLDGATAEGSPTSHVTPPQTVNVTGRPLLFSLPHALFPPLAQGTCAIGYSVERAGEGTLSSARRRLEVRGQLQQLDPPTVEEAIGDTIDPDDVPDGATVNIVANPLIAPDTRVTMAMYGTTTDGVPIAHEGSRDISSVTPFPLRFVVPAAKILALSQSQASFEYSVDTFDTVSGRRVRHTFRPNALYPSPVRTYRIAGVSQSLPRPRVPQADGDTLDPEVIDERIGVRVDVTWDTIALNDRVTLSWQGSKMSTPYTETLTVRGTSVTFLVPKVPYLSDNDGADVQVEYSVAFAAGGTDRSTPLLLRVGAGVGELPPPTVDEATGNTLDPIDAAGGITVRIPPEVTFVPGDVVTAQVGTYTSPGKPGAVGLTFAVPASAIASYVGQSLPVRYTLARDGRPYDSRELPLLLEDFAPEDPRLTAPVIAQAEDDVLDLNTFEGDATVTAAPWPLIAVGQRVWLDADGTRADGSATTIALLVAAPVTTQQVTAGLRESLARASLEALKDGSSLSLRLRVTFDGATDEVGAVRFPLRQYALVVSPSEIYLDFEDLPEQELPHGVPVPLAGGAVMLTALDPGVLIFNDANPFRKHVLYIRSMSVAFDLTKPARYIRFWNRNTSLWPSGIDLYDIDGGITHLGTPPHNGHPEVLFEYTSAKLITKIVIKGRGYTTLDHFTFR